MGRDSIGVSLHVREMRICGQRLWETHEVLTHKASTDACDATCTCGNYEFPTCGENVCTDNLQNLSLMITLVYSCI